MHDLISSFLQEHQFSKTDTQVYLDVYKYDQSFASSIALRTGIDRTTVYSALKRLLKRGIIIQTTIKDIKAYVAVSPEVFIDHLDQQIEAIQSKKKVAKIFIEEMLKIKRQNFAKPRTKIYEGENAIINLYKYTLENPGQQKSFLTLSNISGKIRKFLINDFIKLKLKKNVSSKVLIADSSRAKKYKSLDKTSNRQTKIIKQHPFNLDAEIILFNKSEIAFIDFEDHPYGLILDSPMLFTSIETLFNYIWENER